MFSLQEHARQRQLLEERHARHMWPSLRFLESDRRMACVMYRFALFNAVSLCQSQSMAFRFVSASEYEREV